MKVILRKEHRILNLENPTTDKVHYYTHLGWEIVEFKKTEA